MLQEKLDRVLEFRQQRLGKSASGTLFVVFGGLPEIVRTQDGANTSLKLCSEPGQYFRTWQQGHSSVFDFGVAPLHFCGPCCFDPGFRIEARDKLVNELGALSGRQTQRFGFEFFKSREHDFLRV
jgi:hypothetical protein